MGRRQYKNVAVDSAGNTVSAAQVEVRDTAGSLVTLYNAATGATEAYAGSNPFTADSGGEFEFWVDAPKEIDVTVGVSPTDYILRVYLDGPLDFETREELVTWWAANSADVANGTVLYANSVAYEADSGETGVTGLSGLKPHGTLSPDHFATNTTPLTTDMLQAFTDMIAYMTTSGQRKFTGKGNYLVSGPVVFDLFGVQFISEGRGVFNIYGDHISGPVVQFRKSYSTIQGVGVFATATRIAASYNVMNAGVIIGDFDWEDPTVDNGGSAAWCYVEQCAISDHPGPGVLKIGSAGHVSNNNITDNKGHGVHVDTGQVFGVASADLGFPGWSELKFNKCEGNGGHGICVGSPNNTAADTIYRYRVENNDNNGNALDAAVRYATADYYLVGEQIRSELNVANGARPGYYVAGRQHKHFDNRTVGLTGAVYEIGDLAAFGTRGLDIDEFRINSPTAPLNPAVVVASTITAADGVTVKQSDPSNITNLVAVADRDKYAKITYQGNVNYGGTLEVLDVPVLTGEGLSFTPTVEFATNGDFVPTYSTQVGEYHMIGSRLAFIQARVVFDTNAYTTASGLFILTLPSLPFSMDSDAGDRAVLSVGNFNNVVFDTNEVHASARVNSASSIRLVFNTSTGGVPSADNTANFVPSAFNVAFTVSGLVLVS